MKLFNSILLLAIISLKLSLGSQVQSTSETSRHEFKHLEKLYDANDQILKEIQNQKSNSEISQMKNNFMEKKSKSKKARKSKKGKNGKNKKKKPEYRVLELENVGLVDDPKKLAKYVTDRKCIKKSGYIQYVKERPTNANKVIKVVPVFINLNKHTLSLFKSFEPSSLFQVVKLDNIQRVDLQYRSTFCFDIILNHINSGRLNSGPLSLCAKNIKEMREWINSILEFKGCKITVKHEDHNGKVLVDFQKMNNLVKNKKALQASALASLAYPGGDTAFKMTKTKMAHKMMMKSRMQKIIRLIEKNRILKNQMKRKFHSKMRSARGLEQKIFGNEEVMKNLQIRKNIVAAENEFNLKRQLNNRKQLMLLKQIQHKISQLKSQEITDYKRTWETELQIEKQNANKETRHMMQIIMENQKLKDYQVCYHRKLRGFRNQKFSNRLCYHWYGKWGLRSCNHKENFCTMCCEHHIGNNYFDKKAQCKSLCERNIAGKKVHPSKIIKKLVSKHRKSKSKDKKKKGSKNKKGKKGRKSKYKNSKTKSKAKKSKTN